MLYFVQATCPLLRLYGQIHMAIGGGLHGSHVYIVLTGLNTYMQLIINSLRAIT